MEIGTPRFRLGRDKKKKRRGMPRLFKAKNLDALSVSCNFWKLELAFGQRLVQDFLNFGLFGVARHGQLSDQEVACTLQHLFFAEGKRLLFSQQEQALEHHRDFQQRAGAHLVRVFLEPIFPVLVVIAFTVAQKGQDFVDFTVLHHRPQSHGTYVIKGDFHFQGAGFDFKEVKLLNDGADCATADLLNYSDAMIGINNLVADLKAQLTIHETPKKR